MGLLHQTEKRVCLPDIFPDKCVLYYTKLKITDNPPYNSLVISYQCTGIQKHGNFTEPQTGTQPCHNVKCNFSC